MELFDKNMEALKKGYPQIDEKIKEISIDKVMETGAEQAKNGMPVLIRISQNRKWYLNSRLDPDMAAALYADRYEIHSYGIYFIFGFSDGRCVRSLLKKCDDTNSLVICIPDMEEFTVACNTFDLSDILEDGRVVLYFADLLKNPEFLIQHMVDYTRMKLLEFCILPGYDVIYHELCESYMDSVVEVMRNITANRATHLTFNRSIPQGMLYNMKRMIQCSNVRQLQECLRGKDLQDIPAIIVSAGPSLDKNIQLLKEAQGKAVIIAVDASIRAVMQAGVRPDFLCSIDPNSPERFFTDLNLKDIYWMCCQVSSPRLIKNYADHIFYYGTYGKKWNEILEKELHYPFLQVATGGSVSTEAFMLALHLGFRKIVLIGQDLAFTGGVSHTKGIGDALGDNEEYIKKRMLMDVEGIDGTILKTDFQMWFYKQWFEKVIRINRESIQVIDATEGGARIEGTEIMTLEDVIKTHCTKEFDLYSMEQQIPPMFSVKQQEKLRKELENMQEEILEYQKTVDYLVERQEQILQEMKKASAESTAECLKELTALNQKINLENSVIKDYITMYATSEEYEVGEDIYAAEDLKPEQLVEKSLTLFKGYQKGAKLFLEDFENIILKDEG